MCCDRISIQIFTLNAKIQYWKAYKNSEKNKKVFFFICRKCNPDNEYNKNKSPTHKQQQQNVVKNMKSVMLFIFMRFVQQHGIFERFSFVLLAFRIWNMFRLFFFIPLFHHFSSINELKWLVNEKCNLRDMSSCRCGVI